jgi:hypothetical protein
VCHAKIEERACAVHRAARRGGALAWVADADYGAARPTGSDDHEQ